MPKKKEIRETSGSVSASGGEAREFGLDKAPETPEGVQEAAETKLETVEGEEAVSGAREGEGEGAVEPVAPISDQAIVTAPVSKDPLTQKIESVLEEDLKEVYGSMSPEKQKEFQKKGEEVAGKIRAMIETAKFSFRKALGLIRDWLKMIPGVNKFFLEQEAKIKTDKVSNIAKGGG